MFYRSFQETEKSGSVVPISHGKSTAVRVITRSDGLGFSLSEARCGAGNRSKLWYKNHWEANYVRAGRGSVVNLDTNEQWDLYPGVMYCVGPNDRHSVINTDDPLRIVSIFNPPINGDETHDEDGSYPPTGEIPPRRDNMFARTLEDVRAAGGEKSLANGEVVALRYLTAADQMGFSFSIVNVRKKTRQNLWYKNHWEANLVLDGTLLVIDKNSKEERELSFGDVYCVGPKDPHVLKCEGDVTLMAIFNPPLSGNEKHDEDGAYPPTGPVPRGPR